MGSFSMIHWVVVILVLLLLFGPKRFADAAKGLGQALRGFKEELGRAGEADPHAATENGAKRLPAGDTAASAGDGKHNGVTSPKSGDEPRSPS
jgi:sec-independent protein translocase protein TatA